jgi:hypothetical protein
VTFDAREQARQNQPYELYLFQATGLNFAMTNSPVDITHTAQVYAATNISRTECEISNEVVSGQIKIFLPADHPMVAQLISFLPNNPIAITIFGSHWDDTDTEFVTLFTGEVASARFTDQCELTCNSAQYLLQRKIPQQLYQAPCSHIFGDAGCGANLAAHTYAGSVTAVDSTGTVLTIPAFASLPDPLKGGYLKFGNALRMIVDQSGSTITLLSAVPNLKAGSAVQGVAGCNLDFSSCQHYGRTSSFLGFDLIPTINPFDGSASIN